MLYFSNSDLDPWPINPILELVQSLVLANIFVKVHQNPWRNISSPVMTSYTRRHCVFSNMDIWLNYNGVFLRYGQGRVWKSHNIPDELGLGEWWQAIYGELLSLVSNLDLWPIMPIFELIKIREEMQLLEWLQTDRRTDGTKHIALVMGSGGYNKCHTCSSMHVYNYIPVVSMNLFMTVLIALLE